MTREELIKIINLSEELISPGRPNRPGVLITPTKITIHNTSNTGVGADAKAHSRFVRENGYYIARNSAGNEQKNWVSWHFTVDDKRAIGQLPINEVALHAGTQANNSSIAIEICMHADIDQAAANERAAQLVALLCFDVSIPLAGVVTHKSWTGKNCPQLLLPSWAAFKKKIAEYRDGLKAANLVEAKFFKLTNPITVPANNVPLCWNESLTYGKVFFSSDTATLFGKVQIGFNYKFLTRGEVALPVLAQNSSHQEKQIFLHHQNLSIYFNNARKLALYTACNFDRESLIESVKRSDAFRHDTIDASLQLGQGFYKSKDLDEPNGQRSFDRGHIIARRYNQWGENVEEAKAGERDTYYYTTIHPQVKELNRDEWERLESFIIEHGALDVKRVSIIAGTFLKDDDPLATYVDKHNQDTKAIQIPKLFWKIVYYEVNEQLRKISFLMSQINRLKELQFVKFPPVERLEPDPFEKLNNPLKTYIINSLLIEEHTGLAFSEAKESYQKKEPLEVVLRDNETHPGIGESVSSNILYYI